LATPLSSLGGEPSRFTSTVWSRLQLAQSGDRSAWSKSYLQYRRPLVRFLEKRLPKAVDAELLADEVVQFILGPDFLKKADKRKGRFRDLLLAVARYYIANARRKREVRDKARQVPVDEVLTYLADSDAERIEFATFYVAEVIDTAQEMHREDCRARKSPEAEIMALRFEEGLTQAEIAERVGRTVASVNTLLARGRDRLKACVREVLCPFSVSENDLDEEVRFLLSLAAKRQIRK